MDEIWEKYTQKIYPLIDKNLDSEFRYMKKNYKKYLPKNKNAPILEIGFGRGSFLAYLKREGYGSFLGIEVGKAQVNFVKKTITQNVKLVKNMADFLKKHNNQYELIFLGDVIAHLPKEKIILYLKLARNALKNKGIILIRTPSITNPFCLRSISNDFTYTSYYSYESIQQILSIVDFNEIIIKEENFNIDFKGCIYQIILNIFNLFLRPILILHNRTKKLILTKMMIVIAKK